MKTRLFLFLLAIVCINTSIISQDSGFETYKRQQEQQFRQFVSERDSIMKLLNKDFDEYVEQRNKEYAEYLKNEWEQMQIFIGATPEPGPKPTEIPAFNPSADQLEIQQHEEIIIKPLPSAEARINHREQFREPITVKPIEPAASTIPTTTIDFYGREMAVAVDRSFRNIRPSGTEEKDVAEWFSRAANTHFTPTMIDLLDIAEETGMNDWALYMATKKVAARLANNNDSGTKLYTWFILLQAGYDIRLAKQQQQLVLLMPFSHIVYNTPRLDIENKTFYLFEGIPEEPILTYKQNMPGAFRYFDMNFYKSPTFARKGKDKTITFTHDNKEHKINMQYDPVLVAMLAEQPQAHMSVYLDADGSNYMVRASEKALEPILQQLTDTEKVSLLLKLAQTGFEYETDIDQFGWQKYMVPDEVIHYTYSDCDDRAVLFGWLVRNYAGQKVAALLYPGHLANAVHFSNGNPNGDYVMIDGLEYVVADPTYINAPIGLTMPEFQHVAPTAWLIDSQRYIFDQNLATWQKLESFGARKGNSQRDISINKNGQVYATGYFSNELRNPESRIRLENYGDKRTAFVGLFDSNLKPAWLQAFESDRDATGFSLLVATNGNIIVAGSYSGSLTVQGRTINSMDKQYDAFVAAFQPGGQLLWIQNAELDSRHDNNTMAYSFHPGLNGQPKKTFYHNDPREGISGLYTDAQSGVVLTGTFGNTSGLMVNEAPVSASGAALSHADLLLQKNNELIQARNIETTIAGLFAAIYLSKSEGAVFPGSAAQEAIKKANPRFVNQFPETFANIGKISFLRNKSGIIEIRTENGQDVFFDKMRIRNGSTMRVRTMPGGDEQIDILSNIHVGQMVVWYQLNFIRLNRRSGDLLFDYRSNNSQVTLNLKKDILN
jgi:hypothetical protein